MSELLTVSEAAQYLRLSTRTVYAHLRSGKLAGIKVGNVWRVPAAALRRATQQPSAGPTFKTGAA